MKYYLKLSFLFLSINLFAQEEDAGRTPTIETKYKTELSELSKNKQIQAAFQSIVGQNKQNIEELIMLTEIPAPPFKEDKRAIRFMQLLKDAGVDSVWIDKVGNVVALRKGKDSKRTVVLDAHLDTVFPEGTDVKVKFKGDTLYAPGIGDDTRGLVMVASVLRALNTAKIQTQADILFIGSVGEEGLGDLRGVKQLFSSESRHIDSWISICYTHHSINFGL
jgi:acetylornithine deacetylase/succinyl-diaminopimelate desuccinylase-like protein